jgi:hypothetical protein
VGAQVTLGERLRTWRPRTPELPEDLARLVRPGDPEWFAREMAIAADPPWWFWRFVLRRFSWLVSVFGRVEVTGGVPEDLRNGPLLLAANHIGDFDPFVVAVALHRVGVVPRIMATGGGDANRARYRIAAAITRGLVPLRAGEEDRPAFSDPTRPTTAVAAYPGGVVPDDVP